MQNRSQTQGKELAELHLKKKEIIIIKKIKNELKTN